MFKRLRERLAEEATKLPSQYAPFGNSPSREAPMDKEIITEDLINLTPESSSIVVPQASPQQFSIAEEEEGSFSGQSTPQKKQLDSSGSQTFSTPQSPPSDGFHPLSLEAHNILPLYHPPQFTTYVPQSDIESEIEEPPSVKLDGVSKEQLLTAFLKLRSRINKYKSRYSEVVKAYREVNGEKEKIMKTLSETQDKALRRIAELREQCQLEQKAKAHLEENLRIILEEKEEMINVLETKVKLLKENGSAVIHDGDQTDGTVKSIESSPESLISKSTDNEIGAGDTDIGTLREKVKRQEALLNKCKDTITGNKDRISHLMQEKDKFQEQLELKSKEIQSVQEKEAELQATLRAELQQARERLVQLERHQEESAMAMAETKRNMHEELELKEKQLLQAKDEALLYKQENESLESKVEELNEVLTKAENHHEEVIAELQNRLTLTEKTLDDEKQNLMQELSRGKAAAVTLMQQECEMKIASTIKKWTSKLEELKKQHTEELSTKEEEYTKSIQEKESELLIAINQKEVHMKHEDTNQINRDDLLKTAEEMTVKNTELEGAICQLHEEIRRQQEMYKEAEEIMQANHQKELANSTKALADLEEQCRQSQQKIADAEATICQLKQQQESHREELESIHQDHQKSLQDAQKTIEDLDKQCKALQERQLQCEKEQVLATAQKDFTAAESKYKEQITGMESQINLLQIEKTNIIVQLERLTNMEAEYKTIREKEERATEEANMSKEQVEKLRENLELIKSDYEQKFITMEEKISDVNNEKVQSVQDMKDKFALLEQTYNEVCDRNKDLIAERDALINSANLLNDVIAKHEEETHVLVVKLTNMEEEHISSVEKYQEEIQLLNRQLDESLLVAEANQGVAYQQVTHLKAQIEESQGHVTTLINEKALQEAVLTQQVQELQMLNKQLHDEISSLKNIKQEKELLDTRIQQMEEHSNLDKIAFNHQLDLLKQENENLKTDCINITNLKQEKDELNTKLCALEKEKSDNEKKLLQEIELLQLEIKRVGINKDAIASEEMQQAGSFQLVQSENNESDLPKPHEGDCLNKEVINTEWRTSQDISSIDIIHQQQLESLHEFYKEKLSSKEDEFNSKLKHLVQNLATEWEVKDKDYDQTIYNLIEKAKQQEDKLARDHRLELAELNQQIFEKDSALEEIQEHYLEQLQEKELHFQNITREYEQKLQALQSRIPAGQENNTVEDKQQEPRAKQRTEASDWEDSWAVSEEDVEDPLPSPPSLPHMASTESSEKQCFLHMQQIRDLQTILSENQAELADLKCLLGLTNRSLSSQSLNNSEYSLQVPEATEYEYLRNILFEYMMGKEPLILAKVIAAVLRFSTDQTEQILQKEEARQMQKL